MRVMAARFPDRERASAALEQMHRRFALPPTDVAMAPLGIPGEATDGDTLVAGRFPDDGTAVVDRLVREAGGEIVADIDERWTKPHGADARRDAGQEAARSHH